MTVLTSATTSHRWALLTSVINIGLVVIVYCCSDCLLVNRHNTIDTFVWDIIYLMREKIERISHRR